VLDSMCSIYIVAEFVDPAVKVFILQPGGRGIRYVRNFTGELRYYDLSTI
jgi:hypothetical protein